VPRALAATFAQPVALGRFPGMVPTAGAVSMALTEEGPSPELDRALAVLPPDDLVRTWTEQKLAHHEDE
jgi:hypothetical protein